MEARRKDTLATLTLIMRTNFILSLLLILPLLLVPGCGKSGASKADVSALEEAFKSADAASKDAVAKIVSEIKAANYAGAFSALSKLDGTPGLTPQQQKVVQSALHDLAQVMPPKPVAAP